MITQKQYVDRLEKMITSVDEVCTTCPARLRFMPTKKYQFMPAGKHVILKTWRNSGGGIRADICEMCRDFVDLSRWTYACPCFILINQKRDPRRTAHDAIERYKCGKHKWNKEDKND